MPGWSVSYVIMAVADGWWRRSATLIGARAGRAACGAAATPHPGAVHDAAAMFDAVVGPFVAFFRDHGWRWCAADAAVRSACTRLPDFADRRHDGQPVLRRPRHRQGNRRRGARLVGLVATIVGIARRAACARCASASSPRCWRRGARAGLATWPSAYLALHGADAGVFAAAMAIDNFCNGFAGVALVALHVQPDQLGYTATQYALLARSMRCRARC